MPDVKVIKKSEVREKYIERHKDSLLRLLIEENPERARKIIDGIILTNRKAQV